MSVSWTNADGSVPARIKIGEPWPADPSKYPLSGPSRGPVYCPDPVNALAQLYLAVAATIFAIGMGLGLVLRWLWWLVTKQ